MPRIQKKRNIKAPSSKKPVAVLNGLENVADINNDTEEFQSPATPTDTTLYSLDYTTNHSPQRNPNNRRSSKIVNSPFADITNGQNRNESSDSNSSYHSLHQDAPGGPAPNPSASDGPGSPAPNTPAPHIDNDAQKNQVREKPTNRRKQKQPISTKKREARMLKGILKLQSQTKNIMPKLPFSRLVREILISCSSNPSELRIQSEALLALQESAELYTTQLFEDSYRATLHRGRVTLNVNDIQLVRYLRGRSDPGTL